MEIEFGDVQQTPPEVARRPDQDKHSAVLPVYSPDDDDLPIYIDLDTLREIEEHAAEDTRIELGGVLIGGQCHDDDGRPFVVVTDCLRAEHYEATKGSFKFTHDTWQEISRQLDEFPEQTRMVGWYHTHPDWGVFLSGMDLFICDNFFNKDLDLALVVDPCRHDCGFFQWTGQEERSTRRTGGFYVFASRFRQFELAQFVEWLEDPMMSSDPRFRGGQPPYSPIVQLGEQSSAGLNLAVLAMLAMQFCLLALIAWRLAAPAGGAADPAETQALQRRLDELAAAQQRQLELDAKVAVLDALVGQGPGVPDDMVSQLAVQTGEVAKLQGYLRTHEVASRAMEQQLAVLQKENKQLDSDRAELSEQVRRLRARAAESKTSRLDKADNVASDAAAAVADDGSWFGRWPLKWIAVAALIGVICVGGILASITTGRGEKTPSRESQDAG